MHQVYNMGHRFEIYCESNCADEIISVAKTFDIDAQIVGRTEDSNKPDKNNHLTIESGDFSIIYE